MNGLIYKLVNQILENEGAAKISYGLESFKNIPSLNKFKKSMRFVPVPSTRVYIINPLIYIFLKLIIIFYIMIFNKSPKYNDNFNFLIKIYQGSRILKKLYLLKLYQDIFLKYLYQLLLKLYILINIWKMILLFC